MNLSENPKTMLAIVAAIGAILGGDLGRALVAFVNSFAGIAF